MSTQQALALPSPASSNTVVINARCSLRIEADQRVIVVVHGRDVAVLKVIDFHNHYVVPAFRPIAGATASPAQKQYWDEVNRNLSKTDALLSSIERAGMARHEGDTAR